MDPALAQRLDRYGAWLDHAEAQIDAWFSAAGISNSNDPSKPIDHRALGSIVLTLRRVIALRQTLRDWSQREQPAAPPTLSAASEKAWAHVLSFCRSDDENPSGAPRHPVASHDTDDVASLHEDNPCYDDAPLLNDTPSRPETRPESSAQDSIIANGADSGRIEAMPRVAVEAKDIPPPARSAARRPQTTRIDELVSSQDEGAPEKERAGGREFSFPPARSSLSSSSESVPFPYP